jgi:hypothetical protein
VGPVARMTRSPVRRLNPWHGDPLHHTKEIVVRILQAHKVIARLVPPGVPDRAEQHKPLHFGISIFGIQIEMQPTSFANAIFGVLVQGYVWPLSLRVARHDPTSFGGLAWLIVERLPRELEHSLELVATNDYGPDGHFRSHDLDNGTMLAALGKARLGPTWP